jgi:hypothetical protein
MTSRHLPRYPIFVPTKERASLVQALTLRVLMDDGVPFYAVVEPAEVEQYAALIGRERILELPFENLGQGSIPARNWIKDWAIEHGHERHWQLDDNIGNFRRLYKGQRIPAHAGLSLWVCEEFTDRYENIAISGLAYTMFVTDETRAPFYHNVHVYSCTLFDNSLPFRWRGRYNEDTDICLQALAAGYCTILINAFTCEKKPSMKIAGGNTEQLYQGDGRLKMARALERLWPGVVTVDRRYGRPQHVIDWKRFDTPLKRKPGFDPAALPAYDESGIELKQKRATKSRKLQQLTDEYSSR